MTASPRHGFRSHADAHADRSQADTDLLSDRRARIEEWREWYEGKRAHREQMAAAAHKIISQRYPELVNKPDDYTIEQVGLQNASAILVHSQVKQPK